MSSGDGIRQQVLFDHPGAGGQPDERLAEVAAAARGCQACPLWQIGTQTVFGSGPAAARLMLIGEAPGLQEDRQGAPFVGPAGKLLDEGLDHAGLSRTEVYVTNTVKHRPWEQRNGRQKNRAPKQSEINACRPWLQAELELVRPEIIVCLGATAAKEILGKGFRLTEQRGQWQQTPSGTAALATVHPAYVLIQPEESYARVKESFLEDLRAAGDRYRALPPA